MPSPRPGPLVLYVDDERANRVVFQTSLASEFNIQTVSSADEALVVLEQQTVALLVTDIRMPGMDGVELLERAQERYPRTVRMVVTAFPDTEPMIKSINAALAAGYFIKPWVRAELVQAFRSAIGAWEMAHDATVLQRRLMEIERLASFGSMAAFTYHNLSSPLTFLNLTLNDLDVIATHTPALRQVLDHVTLPPEIKAKLAQDLTTFPEVLEDLKIIANQLHELETGMKEFFRRRTDEGIPSVDPLPIVRHAMLMCQAITIPARAQLSYVGPSELPNVRMSRGDLMQVITNVVANGAQAVAARGSPNGKISVDAAASESNLELRVHDDGIGMDAATLERIGTPFFTTRREGTGLGVAHCQRLIGAVGGRLLYQSEPGVGTTVTITLPLAA